MPWEICSHRGNDVSQLIFESETVARESFSRSRRVCILFRPDGSVAGETKLACCGLPCVGRKRRVDEILKFRHERGPGGAVGRAGGWVVGAFLEGGACLKAFAGEADAMACYLNLGSSKVLFDATFTLRLCLTARSDVACLGVPTILWALQTQGDEVEAPRPILDAIKDFDVPVVFPERLAVTRLALKAVVWLVFGRSAVTYFGASPYRHHSLNFFDVAKFPEVRGYVALTIDDSPCRFGPEGSRMQEVLSLLREHGALATFMVIGRFAEGHEQDLLQALRSGHELGNHGMLDRAYHQDSREDFARAVETCSAKIRSLQREAGLAEGVRWFRSPHGKYTQSMAQVLKEQGLTNTMCDTYACCPVIQDGDFIGRLLARRSQHGSIVLIHMPERGSREWCLDGLRRFLVDLRARGLQAVTVSDLAARAEEVAPPVGEPLGVSKVSMPSLLS